MTQIHVPIAPLTLDQAVERLLDAARSGLCQTYNDNIADGDPYVIPDTGIEAGNVRVFVDQIDTVLVDVPTGVDITADDYQGEDTVRSVILGKSPGLYASVANTIDPTPPAAKGVHVYAMLLWVPQLPRPSQVMIPGGGRITPSEHGPTVLSAGAGLEEERRLY